MAQNYFVLEMSSRTPSVTVSVINLFSEHKLRHKKTQSEVRLESEVLIVHVMAEVSSGET